MNKLSFLTRISLLLGFFFTVDKVLGFVRAIIIAREFKLSTQLDSFNIAHNVPDLLFALISGGALAMAFIPTLTSTLTIQGKAATWALFSRIANLAFVFTAAIGLAIIALAQPIVKFIVAPGFNLQEQGLVASLMQFYLVATVIFSISGLVMAGLQANQHFLLPALAPIMYNLGQIFGAIFLAPLFGVYGLVYGVILGAVLHLAIQIPGLIKYGFHWTPQLTLRDPGVIEVIKMIGPRLATVFFIQLMFIIRGNLASRLSQVGAVTALTYGWMIMQVPETLLGTAIATAILPTLSKLASLGDWAGFRLMIEKALRVLVALTLPAAAIMAAGIHPLIRVTFGFGEPGTTLLTTTTRIYLITLCGYAVEEIFARSFYARKEAWWPFYGVLVRMLVYIPLGILAYQFFAPIGAPVIAFAEISLSAESIIMLIWLNQRLPERITAGTALIRGAIAALFGGGATYLVAALLPGGAVITAVIGMLIGTGIALVIIWPDARLLLNL
jgi:putative peptidoglycan lipid II flippase